ncbi:MAG: hypothetical protein GC137_06435 [Alphaproteobacteria bacterium]|nr:hypothetical protein [Alphaproteobacteria bacterium]
MNALREYIVFTRLFSLCVLMFVLTGCMETFPFDITPKTEQQEQVAVVPTKPQNAVVVQKRSPKISTEKLLDADGHYNIVEQGVTNDPAEAHKKARENVNTRRRNTDKTLSAHFEPDAKSGQDGKLRVLRVGGRNDDADVEFDEDETIHSTGFIKHVSPVFLAKEQGPHIDQETGFVIPPVKPLSEKGKDANLSVSQIGDDLEYENVHGIVTPPRLPDFRKNSPVKRYIQNASNPPADMIRQPRVSSQMQTSDKMAAIPEKKEFNKDGTERVSAIQLRAGDHPKKTRFVVEVENEIPYKVAIDPIRNVLQVKLENVEWQAPLRGNLLDTKLLGGYVARLKDNNQVLIEVRLKSKARIIDSMILQPNTQSKHRIVVDLQKI